MPDSVDPARHWAGCQCPACGQEEGLSLPPPDETYVNAITTVVGGPGFHIDAQTRSALRKAYDAGFDRAEDLHDHPAAEPTAPDFDQWVEEYIEDHERITSD